MIRFQRLSGALIALCGALVCAGAASASLILRAEPWVEGAVITLGDVFENAGEAGDTPLARAPAPGRSTSLDAAFLEAEARLAGLRWENPAGLRRVAVRRPGRRIDPADIERAAAEALEQAHGGRFETRLQPRPAALTAPLTAEAGIRVDIAAFDPATGRFRVEATAWVGAPALSIAGQAYGLETIPVLSAPLARGGVITASDLVWADVRADRLPADAARQDAELIGQAARRSLRAGAPIRTSDLTTPPAIARGEPALLIYETPGLILTVQARALEDAPLGAPARFLNLHSNRTVEAVADGPGRARVGGPR